MRLSTIFTAVLAFATFATADGKAASAKKSAKVEEGKKVFEMNCAACHGPEGKGDGQAAAALVPKPRDLTDAAYMKTRPVETLRKVIQEGGQSVGLSPVMVGWKAALTPDQIESVLQFVLSCSKVKVAKKAK